MAENELKPCPFCGSRAQLNEYYGRESTHFIARCVSCEAQIYGTDKRKTIEAWNRRAKDGRE
jgi:Lar family restriction alleviation protein